MLTERIPLDRYDSPPWFVTFVASRLKLEGTFGEPCCGGGILAKTLTALGLQGWTNDIDKGEIADYHFDATDPEVWQYFPKCDWIVTNPPYGKEAFPIVENAYKHANKGIIFFLRTTWDEPCNGRAEWLWEQPLTRKYVFPRFKFRKNSLNKWATDACTVSAYIWCKYPEKQEFLSVPKSKIAMFHDSPESAASWESVERYCELLRSRSCE